MTLLSPPSLLLSRLFLRRFFSPSPIAMSRASDNSRSKRRLFPNSTGRVASAASDSSGMSKGSSSSVGRNGFPDSQRGKPCVALRGVASGELFNSDDYENEFPPLGANTGSKRKDYGRKKDVGLDQTVLPAAEAPSMSRNSQNPNGKKHGNMEYKVKNQKFKQKTELPFDICYSKGRGIKGFGKERRLQELEEADEDSSKSEILRPGMVLLKKYLRVDQQVEIIKICQRLGVGPGGFYRPGYSDGPKLRLQMMCLGLNWDPETKYSEKPGGMDCKPPAIPDSFVALVRQAIRDARLLVKEGSVGGTAKSVIPEMCPDICIVNYYSTTGRLGLHQDKDESRESIRAGLPIVSFSIGDSAEFLYGDERDVERAESVLLESGDVLIFGGQARNVFHGVNAVIPNSAPWPLLRHSKLRPGRLNLTFRKF